MRVPLHAAMQLAVEWINHSNSYVLMIQLSSNEFAREKSRDPRTGAEITVSLTYPDEPLTHNEHGLETTLQKDDVFQVNFHKCFSVNGEKCFTWSAPKTPTLRVYSYMNDKQRSALRSSEHLPQQCYRLRYSEFKYVFEALLADYGRLVESRYGWRLPSTSCFDAARLSWPLENACEDGGRDSAHQ